MSSINQFKLLKQKNEAYCSLLEKELGIAIDENKVSKARLGFYLFILECITNIKDLSNIVELITDTDFNKIVHGNNYEDYGVDAVYIDDEEKEILLFNFKYREKFNEDSMHSLNDVMISTKFVNAILTKDCKSMQGKIKKYAENIIDAFDSNDVWKFKLYMVSNESRDLKTTDPNIEQLKKLYDLEVIPVSLLQISNYMSLRPTPINAELILNRESMLSYSEDPLSTARSYIIKLAIPELIRITCSDEELRKQYNNEDYSKLNSTNLNYGVLFDNVRGYLGETKYNKNIFLTLKEEPHRFFMFNNGLTITVKNIETQPVNGQTKLKFDLEDIQIVNGGQTLRTLYKFKADNNLHIDEYLAKAEILVRIFKTGNDSKLINKIAEFTNSQNAISPTDLKSISNEQIEIEQFLETQNIAYIRKIGDTGKSENSNIRISMEKFAQILFAIKGYPDKTSNQKKQIFEKYYDEIFGNSFDINNSAEIIKTYYDVLGMYKKTIYEVSDQKLFYIMYLMEHSKADVKDLIDKFEAALNKYKETAKLPPARKLIHKAFKEHLDKEVLNQINLTK